MGKQKRIRKIDENGKIFEYTTAMEAAKNIPSKIEDWKIAIYILDAINTGKRAYKSTWKRI